MTKNTIAIVCIIIAIAIVVVNCVCGNYIYNNGECSCGGHWELIDIEKGYRNGTTYYYQCTECENFFSSMVVLH
jgi:hypothetical protein